MNRALTREQLTELYCNQGLSYKKIADITGYPQTTVGNWIRDYGLADGTHHIDQYGENNPAFKDGKSKSTLSRITKKLCEDAHVPLNYCQRCHKLYEGNLDRHHVDHNKDNNTIHNIIVICPSCHAKEHDPERRRDSLGRYL